MAIRSKIKPLSHVQQSVLPTRSATRVCEERSGAISTDKQAKPKARRTDLQYAQDKFVWGVCVLLAPFLPFI